MSRGFSPRRLDEALRLLAEERPAVVAGCTDLMVVGHAHSNGPTSALDVLRIKELSGIREDDGWLDLGAAVSFTELRHHPLVHKHQPVLAEVAGTIGAWQIQNRATLGGNIANASPAGDSLPMWLALGAELELASRRGQRHIGYDDFHTGYRKTALAPDELVVRVRVPFRQKSHVTAFRKVGTRAAQAISKVVVALCAERQGKRLTELRLAAGSVAATPVRLKAAERAGLGKLEVATADAAGAAAAGEVTPIDDVRSTADYRRHVLGQVVRRLLLELA